MFKPKQHLENTNLYHIQYRIVKTLNTTEL